jgi:hypothetical protein
MGQALFMLPIMLAVTGCGAMETGPVNPHSKVNALESVSEKKAEPCGAIIDWADFLMIDNINYDHDSDRAREVTPEQLGDKVGEVSFMLNEHACTGHVVKNGDAAFLPIGTSIYAMKGYNPEFRVIAGNKIYQVRDNPNAATMGDLFDIDGRVEKVSLESGVDGSPIGDFSAEASSEFIQELLPLSHVGFEAVYEKSKHESGIFLRVHLKDRTSFRMVFYPEANAFTAGAFGTERLKELIMTQREQIKAAAGL